MTDITYRVTTYFRRPRGETGITQLASLRLRADQALQWVMDEFPDDSWDCSWDEAADVTTIRIDWAKVPAGIREPAVPARRR